MLCAGMAGCSDAKSSHVLTKSARVNNNTAFVVLSACGGLMVVVALVASGVVVVRRIVEHRINEELKRDEQ